MKLDLGTGKITLCAIFSVFLSSSILLFGSQEISIEEQLEQAIQGRDEICSAIQTYAQALAQRNITKIVILLGHAGEGKSTVTNFIASRALSALRVRRKLRVQVNNPIPGIEVGEGQLGVTQLPHYHEIDGGIVLFDTPGILDPDPVKELKNAFVLYKIFTTFTAHPKHAVLVVAEDSISDRTGAWKNTIDALGKTFCNNITEFSQGLSLVVTKSRDWFQDPIGIANARLEIQAGQAAFPDTNARTILNGLQTAQIVFFPAPEIEGSFLNDHTGNSLRTQILVSIDSTAGMTDIIPIPSPSAKAVNLARELIESVSNDIRTYITGTIAPAIVTYCKREIDQGQTAQQVRATLSLLQNAIASVGLASQQTLRTNLDALLTSMGINLNAQESTESLCGRIADCIEWHRNQQLRNGGAANAVQNEFVVNQNLLHQAGVSAFRNFGNEIAHVLTIIGVPCNPFDQSVIGKQLNYLNCLILFTFKVPIQTWRHEFISSNQIVQELARAPQPAIVSRGTHQALVLKAVFLGIDDMQRAFNNNRAVSEINAFSSRKIYCDSDLTATSTSCSIVAPAWKILQARTFSLRGLDGADAPLNSGSADGANGRAGTSGGHGGSFIGLYKAIDGDLGNLTVDVSGGTGGRGSNGNPGRPGSNGPSGDIVTGTEHSRTIDRDYGETPIKGDRNNRKLKHGQGGWYHRLSDYLGDDKAWDQILISYVPVTFDKVGSPGTDGGPGGKGGKAGTPGKKGTIVMNSLANTVANEESATVNQAKNGTGGAGGAGGVGGFESKGERWKGLIVWDCLWDNKWAVPPHCRVNGNWENMLGTTDPKRFDGFHDEIWHRPSELAKRATGSIDKEAPHHTNHQAKNGNDGATPTLLIDPTSSTATPALTMSVQRTNYDSWITAQRATHLATFIESID